MVRWNNITNKWEFRKPTLKCWLFHRHTWYSENSPFWRNNPYFKKVPKPLTLCWKCKKWWL